MAKSVHLHVLIPEELHSRLQQFLPRKGMQGQLVRKLLERQITHWDQRAAAKLGAPVQPLESALLDDLATGE